MQSEIRESDINLLFEKVNKQNFGNYLFQIEIIKLRGINNKTVTFDFPVTALIGPNGGGKTTVLGAAGLLYKDIKPKRFFAKNSSIDNSMSDWKVEYKIIDKNESQKGLITKSASYGYLKWSRSAVERSIAVFGISRTVPPSEKVEFTKYASNTFKIQKSQIFKLSKNVADAVGKILGKDVNEYSEIKIDEKGSVSFLTGRTDSGIEYSEFHFGAGESSVIRMISSIELMPENSIILIEEIENGLHPIATRRMVEYLIEVASRKKIQSIFSTHSNEALIPLPYKAIWIAANGEVYQGKLDIKSLRAITGQIKSQLAIFTEDLFSKEWIESVIRLNDLDTFDLVEVHGLQGDGMAVTINRNHNIDPTIKSPSICYIDGDSSQNDNEESKVYRLPGLSPEAYIFDKVLDIISQVKGQLSVALHLPFEKADFVEKSVKETRTTNRDEHLLFSQVGRKLGFISENIVRNAFLSIWNENYKSESAQIFENVKNNIPNK
ncbi:ATP-dependent nuclease [Leptospira meyeri]|uniref:ATP-dependent nuclease n=1 Tax=Leptospira meyeri TaxID=29508 RepID=UPI00223D7F42|nr:AAA family ATPase [Leptospira meyeri]MCW7490927.1 AAA family ATPase [Leptospira meyeri]